MRTVKDQGNLNMLRENCSLLSIANYEHVFEAVRTIVILDVHVKCLMAEYYHLDIYL